MNSQCSLAETVAGAIAVGEASDTERESYRAHLVACPRCLQELGGERDVERVMAAVSEARDDERWEPDIRKSLVARRAAHATRRWAAAAATAFIAIAGVFLLEKKPQAAPAPPAISAHETRALAALGTESAVPREGRAESLVVGTETPVTSAFTLSVDRRGNPLRCTITKSSGDGVLDRAVCRAALHVRYTQR